MTVNWYPLRKYEGTYEINKRGQIQNKYGSLMKTWLTPDGYERITLVNKAINKKRNHYVHRLVAKQFIRRIKGKNEVNHKNLNRTDNRYLNLEWVDRKENCNMRRNNLL